MRGKRKAFTLIEVLVVAAIFAMLSTADLINYRNSDRTRRLSAAADELASRIKTAQGMAYANTKQMICSLDSFVCLSGSRCDTNYPANCISQYIPRYGVRINLDRSKTNYMVGADYQGRGLFDIREAIPNGKVTLPTGITIDSVTPLISTGDYNLVYIYDSANASPFVTCSTNCLTTIVLKDNQTNATKTITIQKRTGLVTVY